MSNIDGWQAWFWYHRAFNHYTWITKGHKGTLLSQTPKHTLPALMLFTHHLPLEEQLQQEEEQLLLLSIVENGMEFWNEAKHQQKHTEGTENCKAKQMHTTTHNIIHLTS
jgi:hypothetical protein